MNPDKANTSSKVLVSALSNITPCTNVDANYYSLTKQLQFKY